MRRWLAIASITAGFFACATTEDPPPAGEPTSDASTTSDGAPKTDGSISPPVDGSIQTDGASTDASTKDSTTTDSSVADSASNDAAADVANDTATSDAADGGCPGATVNPTCVPPSGNFAVCGTATATTEYSSSYAASKANDGDVNTGWYSEGASCPSGTCPGTTIRWEVELNTPRTIGRLKLFGNRDYPSGWDVLTARFEMFDGNGVSLYGADVTTSRGTEPNGDVDHVVTGGRACVKKISVIVKTGETGENDGPGFAELEAYAN